MIAKKSQRRFARLCLRPDGAAPGDREGNGSTFARAAGAGTLGVATAALGIWTMGGSFDPRNGTGAGLSLAFFFFCFFNGSAG